MTLLHQAAQKAVEALTTLVQEYAADCEAVALEKHCFSGDSWKNKQTVADATLARLRANLESALQQQPEPVGYVHPLLLRELQRGTSLSIPLVARSEADTDEGGDVPLYTAPPALQHQEEPSTAVIPPAPPECGTEDEKTAFSFGYWQGLHAARKGQEVPREPVAFHTGEALRRAGIVCGQCGCPDLMYEGVAASPSTTRQQEVGSEALGYATRLACSMWGKHYRDDAPDWRPLPALMGVLTQIDNMTAGLAKKQEVGSGYEKVGYFMEDSGRWLKMDDIYADDPDAVVLFRIAAAPSTPEKAGGVPACVAASPAPSDDWSVARDCAVCGRMATPGGPCQRTHGVSAPIPHPLPAQANDGGEQ